MPWLAAEAPGHVGHEPHRLPACGAPGRDHAQPVPGGNGLDARIVAGVRVDQGAVQLGVVGPRHFHGNPRFPHRTHRPRMQGGGPHRGQGRDLVVGQPADEAGIGNNVGIRGEQPGNVRPDLQASGPDAGREVGGGGVGASPAQENGVAALRVAGQEPLGDDGLLGKRVEPLPVGSGEGVAALRGQVVALRVVGGGGVEHVAGVQPAHGEAVLSQPRRAQERGQEFAVGQEMGQGSRGPAGVGRAGFHPGPQRLQSLADLGNGPGAQGAGQLIVAGANAVKELPARVGRPPGNGGQIVGGAPHRGQNHEGAVTRGDPAENGPRLAAPALRCSQARPPELQDTPRRSLRVVN
jgi:hypothetical protein